jgi:tetratricopeptide (TPR) repeat protein
MKKNMAGKDKEITPLLNLAELMIEFAILSHENSPEKPLTDYNELLEAQTIASNLTRTLPFLPRTQFLKGKSSYLLNQQKEAFDAFNAELKLDPSAVEAYKYQAMILSEKKETDQAIKQLGTALLFAPNDSDLREHLAALYQKSGNLIAAAAVWEAAIRYSPNDLQSILAFAKLKLVLRNPEEALTLLSKALKIAPSNPEALKLQLIAIYNPLLQATNMKASELKQKQEQAFEAYHKVAPQEAEDLRKNSLPADK